MTDSRMTYVPTAEEVPYYNALFSMADTQRTGSIGGAQAVQFFSRSKLPVEVLKNVWTIADQPTTNSLDKAKFAVAVRLIQLIQNGVKGQGNDLRAPEGVALKPAFFEGVPLPAHEQSPQQQMQQQQPPQQQQMQQQPPQQQQMQQQPPQQQQMQQQPPQQQQMQQQPPQQQQMQMPPRPPMHQQQQPPGAPQENRALTVQDPYMLTPTEQARYEEIFPSYAKPDGFVYGKEAVELFSKSGVPQNNLAAIWKMVDEPVDNRLDKLEFAMAMHLIVCLSRKNLPMPPSLPNSLKQLKSQRPQQPPDRPQHPPSPQQQGMPPPQMQPQQQGMPSPQMQPQQQGMPPPQMQPQQQGMPPPQMQPQQQGMPPPQQGMNPPRMQPGSPKSQMQSPLQSIPSPTGMGGQGIPSPQRSSGPGTFMGGGMPPPPLQSWNPPATTEPLHDGGRMQSHTKNESIGGNASVMSQLSSPPPLPSGGVGISDAFDGLEGVGTGPTDINSYLASAPPVQTVSSLDDMNKQEEPQVSAPAPVAVQQEQPPQMAKPHFEMPPHMRQNAASNSVPPIGHSATSDSLDLEQLREALQKLQAENISLKAQMGHLAEEETVVSKQVSQAATELSQLSSQLTQVRAQMLASKARLMEATAELNAAKQKKDVIQDLITEVTSTKEAIDDATKGVEETLQQVNLQSKAPPVPQSYSQEGDLFSFDSSPSPAPVQDAVSSNHDSSSPYDSQQYLAPKQPLQPMGQQDSLIQTVASQSSYEETTTSNGHHTRDSSGWFSGGIMGGEVGGSIGNNNVASLSFSADVKNVLSPQAIEELKAKHREAENVARDAEESRRQIVAQTDELRRLADEAEKNLREYSKETDDKKKKKGMFGSGGRKKKDAKHADELAQDARKKKDAFMQAQSQLNDATSLAKDTKAEAERLAKEIEDAEISAASAASMESAPQQHQPQPPHQPYYPPAERQPPQSQQYGSYSGENSFGVMGAPSNSSYNPSVMGGGGLEIPTPTAAYDVYDNPFAS